MLNARLRSRLTALPIQCSLTGCLICQALADANARDAEGVPLLHWAAINDRRSIVKYLLKLVSIGTNIYKARFGLIFSSPVLENGLCVVWVPAKFPFLVSSRCLRCKSGFHVLWRRTVSQTMWNCSAFVTLHLDPGCGCSCYRWDAARIGAYVGCPSRIRGYYHWSITCELHTSFYTKWVIYKMYSGILYFRSFFQRCIFFFSRGVGPVDLTWPETSQLVTCSLIELS